MVDDASTSIRYSSGKSLMEHGADALHDHMSAKMVAGRGRGLPQMEVRFKNLSITTDVVVSNEDATQDLLPTLPNVVLQSLSNLSARKTKETKHILKNVNGVFKPGTMTLVLGQAGSAKSSLMKILSGRFPLGKSCTLEGEILYNGANIRDVQRRLPQFVSYVTQRDIHFPMLTVKETLEFAHECCGCELSKHAADQYKSGTPEQNREALEAAQAWVEHYPQVVLQQLGLEICEDTIVGDVMTRGVSGGERKRVTTGEMQFGNKAVNFMDEISTGLDSAATYDIIKTQRSLAHTLRKTVVISLLQPSPEVFELFDYVMILNQGRVIYHGPKALALSHFEELGFTRPADRDVADFLLDIGTQQQHQYEKGRTAGVKYPRTAAELAEAYERSAIHEEMLSDLHAPQDPHLVQDRGDFFDNVPEFHQSITASMMTLLRQQAKVTWRNTPFIASRVVMVVFMGLINGSVFWQIDPKQVQIVMGVLFQAVLFISFGQYAQIPTFFAARDVFYKQRGANFYRTASYVLAFSLNQLPLAAAETLVFGSMVYWMCGLVASASAFVIFELILLLTSMAMTSLFFLFSAATPNMTVGNPIALIVLSFVVLYCGFAISETQIPRVLVWIYWIDPMTWSLRALAINQYTTSDFDVPVYQGIDYYGAYGKNMGEYSLDLVGLKTDKIWLWMAFAFIGGVYVLFLSVTWYYLEFSRFEQPGSSDLGKNEDETLTSAMSTSPPSSTGSEYTLAHTPRGDSNGEITLEVKGASRNRKVVPVTLAFQNLWYTVPNPQNPKEGLDLLQGISGYATPGTITALMGSSGAGKTTLMDVIAGRKTGGQIQGQILLNGFPATPLAIQRSTGYCEQMDIHSSASTFREALTFSASLRQDDAISESEKFDWVDECLDLLDLRPIADKIIRGSSVEQMKRLTIGVEMVARPSVLFLDEPTSGLDARSAKLIMDSVRKVAVTGVTVVCTIHQPSWDVFQGFDSLLLLQRGGYTVYFGELGRDASELVTYLTSIDGVTPLPKKYNPATWMLEAIGAGVGNSAGQTANFAEIYKQSAKKALMESRLDRDGVGRPAPGASALSFMTKRASSTATQAKFLIGRAFSMYWRTASHNLTRLGVQLAMGLLFGVSYCAVEYQSYQGINGGVAMVFFTTLFSGFIAFSGVIPVVGEDRAAFYRERASQTYNAFWYFAGVFLAEILYNLASALVFTTALFPLVQFQGVPEFFFYWLIVALYLVMTTYIGIFLAFAMPSVEVAMGIGILVQSIWALVVGFNPPASAIPSGYKWLYQLTPQRYALETLASLVFGNCDAAHSDRYACKDLLNPPPTVRSGVTIAEFIDQVYSMKYDNMARDVGAMMAFSGAFALFTLAMMRYVNHTKR